MSEAPWLLLLGRDGTVLLTASGAPASWVGKRVATLEELPEEVREAGRRLVLDAAHLTPSGAAGVAPSSFHALPGGRTLQMVALEAVLVKRVPTDLTAVLTGTTAVLKTQARSLDIELRIEASARVPRDALLDPEKVAWAILTLVGNAMRYVRRGTRRLPGGAITVTLDFASESGELVIVVEDDGPGIPADKLPWLFARAHDTAHAAGLGLMLLHDVVTAHGGTVTVESSTSAVDHGTRVTLRLPVR